MEKMQKKFIITIIIASILISSSFGAVFGFISASMVSREGGINNFFELIRGRKDFLKKSDDSVENKIVTVKEESAVISTVEKVSPAVVSIIVSKDLPVLEKYYSQPFNSGDLFDQFFGGDIGDFFGFNVPQYRQKGMQKQEIGGGTGFIVSSDGYIITNKHVVSDEDAEYTVLMNDESKHEAKVLARDPINDIAIIKIEGKDLTTVDLGDSTDLKVGQSVIAIGNALGEFRNTVSTGVISGLSRSVTAGGAGIGSEDLVGLIQTDASINPGNSGGPLLNLAGQVIGINTAMAQGAENIGFTIPVNEIKSVYESVKQNGKIVRPWLGVRYVLVTKDIAEQNKLDVDYGALIIRGDNRTDLAVVPGSPADKAGLVENDIILEINGKKIDEENPLAREVSRLKVGDEIILKILHRGDKKDVKVKLEEMK